MAPGPSGGPKTILMVETGVVSVLGNKIVQETCVCFYGNNSEEVTKVTQTTTKYDQLLTPYAP